MKRLEQAVGSADGILDMSTSTDISLHNDFEHYDTSHWGGSVQVIYTLLSLCPATELCGVFSNETLPSSYSGQPKAT
ncbi:hypothetical protein STEG23_017363, partial [Scotinomys teguina]